MSQSVVIHFGRKIFGILHWFVASIRRLFCCLRRRKSQSDFLPFTVKSQQNNDGAFLENWESWDSKKMKQKSAVETQIEEYRQRLTSELTSPPVEEEEDAADADYFLDMQPDYKKGKKILLKPKNAPQSPTNKFAMQTGVAIVDSFNTSELGVLDEFDDRRLNWDVDEDNLDVDSVLKEAKMKERMERVEKHKQKKNEKVKQQTPCGGGKLLEAVKLS